MTKTPNQILRDIFDSDRLTAQKALDAIEELDADTIRGFADELNEIAGALEEARDAIDAAVQAREDGTPRDEQSEYREAALAAIGEAADQIDGVEIPEAFEALNLDRVGG